MADYPPIAEHGLIGDLQTAALVATDGSVDWFCAPRFDSPSIFGALLHADSGGYFRIGPVRAGPTTVRQLYVPDTAILITRFLTEDGVGEVIDFMPISGKTRTDVHRLVRLVRCVRGAMTFTVDLARACTSPTATASRPAAWAGARSVTCSPGSATTGTSRRRASGRPAAAARTSPTAA
ncbi:trehalase-like domain-containing protein [Actinoplanes subtropicus]|uniref:trehalase-like domain-containing protein n=1 Tax=Actinoplanes subtropicus TaxID=543632 RepID=UPI0004C3F832|nr:trehalase-like domain-containing protein [Actinoplanes subtropicus]